MINSELYNIQWHLPYEKQLEYLKDKYGKVPFNYFKDLSCEVKSSGITRTEEGLFIHHDFEFDPNDDLVSDLSKPVNARHWPWKY